MDDPEEARRLVEAIRAGLGIQAGGALSNVAIIAENSLRMLSEELYSKPARFLLELIQNADDNTYAEDVSPHLSIVYRSDGYLWLGCNERGFSEDNLRAVCTVGRSTKKVENNRKGYIGEKGIGFKSVFQVADIVWVKSAALEFKFDKSQPLGMVAPIWGPFHANAAINEQTMFCFRIPDITNRNNVAKNVAGLDAELLLFLRQIRSVSITTQDLSSGASRSQRLQRQDTLTAGFRLTELVRSWAGEGTSTAQESVSERFIVCQHTAQDMPIEPKRPGISESDVLVAFPVDADCNPVPRTRNVYNFLPIRNYNLNFILQGDFILSANREDIQEDNLWNSALVAAAQQLILESIDAFNQHGILQYTWPQYLSWEPMPQGTVFDGFFQTLVQQLRLHRVLQSQNSTLERPRDLLLAPAHLTDGQEPLLTGPHGLESFVHNAYRSKDLGFLNIPQQSTQAFLELLHEYLWKHPDHFRQRLPQWHSNIAVALVSIGPDVVRGLKLIPARSGRWMAASGSNMFFPEMEEGTVLPGGIEVDVVDDMAAKDDARRRLFTALGVKTLDEAKVVELILHQHARKTLSEKPWSVGDVVEHAWFLFRAVARPSHGNIKQLLVASTDGKLRHGKETYMDVPGSLTPVSGILGSARTTVRFLHEQYLSRPSLHPTDDPAGPGNLSRKWLSWLDKSVGVRVLPKLAASGSVSAEFDMVINSSRANEWLQLLIKEPEVYSKELQAGENDAVRYRLANSKVLCTDGTERPLKDVYLPTFEVLSEPLAKGSVPMLMVDNPDDARWSSLDQPLHLRRGLDAHVFIAILLRMQGNRCPFTVDDVRRMYTGLARRYNYFVKQEFTSKPLVYIASPQPAKWVKFDVCRWDAPEAIITLFALNQRFKQNADLFTRRLGLGSASAADAVIELKKLNGRKDAMDTIRELLKILSTYVEEGKLNVDSLRGLTNNRVKILPVNIGQHTELCSFFDNNWFIEDEDMPILVECFQGFVRVVDCDYLTKRKPRVLLEKLGCLANLLSERYSVQNEAQGQVSFEPALTKNLRAKAEYLSRLVEEPRRQEAFYKLSALEVRSADEIVIKRYVKIGENKVFGRDEEGTITLKEDGPGLVIYYSRRRTAPALIPFYQIHEQFVEALDIHKRHRTLAMTILMTEDNLLIESELERAGCGRPKTTADGTANASSGKSATRSMVLDLTARTQKRPALNTSSDHTVKIGSSVRFGGSGASKPGPECYNAAGTGAALPTAFSRPSGYSSSPSPLIQLPNGFVGSGSSNRRDSAQPRALGSTRSNGSSAYDGTGSNIDTKKMDLSLMRSQLEEAVALENEKHVSSQSQQTVVVDATSATEAELAIGRAGETFVYELLKKEIGVDEYCWTSNSRSQYPALRSFDGNEADYADFTISDPKISAKMTDWLLSKIGIAAAAEWLNTSVTYHAEVKTTSGHLDEAFDMSNNQGRLAKEWHASPRDVMIIVRVFHILSDSPSFHVYVDPVQLRKSNALKFVAKGGYYVTPN